MSLVNQNKQISYKVAAYITAYQDSEALTACIRAIQAQSYPVQQILVVDNSSPALLLPVDLQTDSKIILWFHPENIGIAGGIRLGIEWAIQHQCDFIWTFDQDSIPTSECLELLLKNFIQAEAENCQVAIIAPLAIDQRTGQIVQPANFCQDHFQGFDATGLFDPYKCHAPITSGSLVSIKAVSQIDLPDDRLFIDGIDLDYGMRLNQAGFQNFVVPNAKMYHQFGIPRMIQFLGQEETYQIYSPLRHYYICRNHTHLALHYSKGKYRLTCGLRRIKYLIFEIVKILIFDPNQKLEKIFACLTGTLNGFLGRIDKAWLQL